MNAPLKGQVAEASAWIRKLRDEIAHVIVGQQTQSADIDQNSQATDTTNQSPVEAAQQKMAQQYSNLFRVFLEHRNSVKLVTFWGVTDADSWRRNGSPLLFDENGRPKPAFDAVIKTAR